MPAALNDLDDLSQKAGEAAGLLKLLANERRLFLLCKLAAEGEMTVGRLAEAVGLSQSALSQHLALMRDQGLVVVPAGRTDAPLLHRRPGRRQRPWDAPRDLLRALGKTHRKRKNTVTQLKEISAEEARRLVSESAILVDVRETYEQAMERIPGSVEMPLSRLAKKPELDLPAGRVPVFLCASGNRTRVNSAALAAITGGSGYCLAGGIAAWKRAGYPTER